MILDAPDRLPDAQRPYTPDVFYRSLLYSASRVSAGVYRVGEYWVNLKDIETPSCDCGFYLYGDKVCKHMVASLTREGDFRCLKSLTTLILETAGADGSTEERDSTE